MILRDDDLMLRPYHDVDRSVLPTLADNPRVSRFLSLIFPTPYTQADADAWVDLASDQNPTLDFAIEWRGSLAGGLGLTVKDGDQMGTADLGYWLAEPNWGKGLMTRAVRLALPYAFRTLRFDRLQALVHTENPRSAHVLEHCGFVREGLFRKFIKKDGERRDAFFYGLLREDWTATKAP